MSNNVSGQGGNQNIKLYNGKSINIKKLDKLIGQSIVGSVFAHIDGTNGGVKNNIFDEAEINALKQQFLQAQANDGVVSQDELNLMFGAGQLDENGNKKDFNVNNLTSTMNSIKDDEEVIAPEVPQDNEEEAKSPNPVNTDPETPQAEDDSDPAVKRESSPVQSEDGAGSPSGEPVSPQANEDAPPPQQKGTQTTYMIQPGDSPYKIAKKLGLSGAEADRVINQLKGQLNSKGWFVVGQRVTISGDYSAKIEEMKAEPEGYSEDISELNQRWAASTGASSKPRNNKPVTPTPAPNPPAKPAAKPAAQADNTPKSQRMSVTNVRTAAKKDASSIKEELTAFWTSNSTARKLLEKGMSNTNAAYVLEEYPNLVSDIDNVVGMNKDDIKKYVIDPLNSRLRELGYNKHGIPTDNLDKLSVAQLQKICNDTATLIRNVDKDNGYVFKPLEKDTGKIHPPRKTSQNSHLAWPKPKTTQKPAATPQNKTNNTKSANNSKSTNNNKSANYTPRAYVPGTTYNPRLTLDMMGRKGVMIENGKLKPILLPEEKKYPAEMQEFIIRQREKGLEYTVQKGSKSYTLTLDLLGSTYTPLNSDPKRPPVRTTAGKDEIRKVFKVAVPFNVTDKMDSLKKLTGGNGVEMKKDRNGKYTITQTGSSVTSRNLKSIRYVYDADGNFLYQLEASSTDQSIKIGKMNAKTKKIEYTQFKDAKGLLTNENMPNCVKEKYYEIKAEDPNVEIVRGYNTYTIIQTAGRYLEVNGLTKIVHKYNGFGNCIAKDYTYTNGRTQTYLDASNRQNDGAHTANPITMPLPEQYQGVDSNSGQMIYGLNTKGPKDTAQRFARGLESNKKTLMRELNLTNEEYDNLATLAMGIAEQETHFGQKKYVDTKGKEHAQNEWDSRAKWKNYANEWWWSNDERANHSQGITQIRYNEAISDEQTRDLFLAHGIKDFDAFITSPEKQAVATMIILRQRKNIAESDTWQRRLVANNRKIAKPEDRLTTNDIIALSWNGLGGVTTRMENGETITINSEKKSVRSGGGHMTPNGMVYSQTKTLTGAFYARAVRAYTNKFFADPKHKDPSYNGAQHMTSAANQAGAMTATGQDNGGALGEVVFMPKSYSNAGRVASPQTKEQINALIDKNTKLSPENKELLKSYVQNDSVGFGNRGLTEAEALQINDNDVALMTRMISGIKAGTITANQANTQFESAQLESRQFTVKSSTVSKANLLASGRSSNPKNNRYLSSGLNFEIHSAFYNGVKRNTARPVVIPNNAYQNTFAITKSKGVNPYLANGGVARANDRVLAEYADYAAQHLYNSGGNCKNGVKTTLVYALGIDNAKIRGAGGKSLPSAKDLTQFYNAHPEVFSQVRWVDTGNGNARELNSTDVNNLPCGYIGVFTPGAGFNGENADARFEHGHAFFSDGFGECNADEHDNGKWTHFGSGKGEHGKLDVYKLKDDVVPVYSEKLGRTVLVSLSINPWYLTPEFRELQEQECQKRGRKVPEYKEEFPV